MNFRTTHPLRPLRPLCSLRPQFLLLLCFLSLPAFCQVKWNQRYQNYIDKYKDVAINQMQRYHIPASITLAQGLLESAAGESELARKGNNHFGIKCHGWNGRKVYHDDDARGECFRAYNSAVESFEDHSVFLSTGQRYASLFRLSPYDYKGWAHGLKAAGYATNPQYAYKLIDIIEAYQLYQYDYATSSGRHTDRKVDTPAAQPSRGSGRRVGERLISHEVKVCNGVYYVLARSGDTFESIGHEMGVRPRLLAKYNELPLGTVLQPGTSVYLEKKKNRADKSFARVLHVVQPGESYHSIAQMYAIKLSALRKMNRAAFRTPIQVGEEIRLY